MPIRPLPALASLALGLCALSPIQAAQAQVAKAQVAQAATATLTVVDNADPTEVEEATTVFINGRLVATFVLNADHQSDEKQVVVPAAHSYDYALCGRVTVRGPDGNNVTHVLDDGATLKAVDGRRFEALAGAQFTVFYLAERAVGWAAALPGSYPDAPEDIHRTHVCDIPTA